MSGGEGVADRRSVLSAGSVGAAILGITTMRLAPASASSSPLGSSSDPSFVQTATTSSNTGTEGFPAYNLTSLVAIGSTLYVASYDVPSVVGAVAAADLTVSDSVELPSPALDLAGLIATDGTHLYVTRSFKPEDADVAVTKVLASDLSVVGSPLALPGFEDVGALVVAGTELLVVGTTSTGGRITKVLTGGMTVYGSLDLPGAELLDAAVASPYLYAVSGTGELHRIVLTGGPAGDGGLLLDATLDIGDRDIWALVLLDGHAYLGDGAYSDIEVRKVQLTGGTGAGGMEVVGALALDAFGDEDLRSAATDGTSLFFGGMTEAGTMGRIVKVRPTGGTAPGSGGMVRVGAVDPTDPDGWNLQQVSDLVSIGGAVYAVGDGVVVKVAAGT